MLKATIQREVSKNKEKRLEKVCSEAEDMQQRGFSSGVFRTIRDLTSEQLTHLRRSEKRS